MMPTSFQASSSNSTGPISSAFRSDASGFVVTNHSGLDTQQLLLIGGLLLAGALLWKKLR